MSQSHPVPVTHIRHDIRVKLASNTSSESAACMTTIGVLAFYTERLFTLYSNWMQVRMIDD